MEIIKIILLENGQLESVLSEGEINVEILKRGIHDTQIDKYETILESVDI